MAPAAASTAPPTAARRGRRSAEAVSLPRGSAGSASPSRRAIRSASTRSWTRRRAASTPPKTAARRGRARLRNRGLWGRGWYFGGVTVDPKNPDTVYVCNVSMYRSTDGGKTFVPIKGAPGGDDYHQLWIDPADSRRMIAATDQGAVVTVDGAKTWSSWYNQPTAQFYHVATDNRFPYWIYGAQQDTGAAATPSRTDYGTILLRDWKPIAAGGENGYIAPDPTDPNILYGGGVDRFDLTTLQEQNVDPTLAYPGDYRGEWTLPLAISPRDPKRIYFANQFLFKTTDAGQHWEKASPDLTREDPGVPATLDAITARDTPVAGPRRGVIYTIAPSPVKDGLVWCGTNDGLIWRTPDDGKHWDNVTPKEITAVVEHLHPRGLALRRGHGLCRRGPPPPGRHRPPHLQDARRRQDLAPDRRRHPGGQLRQRRARGPRAPRPALRGNGDRRLRLLRRRRPLAAPPGEPAQLLGARHLDPRRRPRHRDPRPLLLGPGRHRAAARAVREDHRVTGLALRAARRRPHPPGVFPGHALPQGRAGGGEPAKRRDPRLLPEGRLDDPCDNRDPGRQRRDRPPLRLRRQAASSRPLADRPHARLGSGAAAPGRLRRPPPLRLGPALRARQGNPRLVPSEAPPASGPLPAATPSA